MKKVIKKNGSESIVNDDYQLKVGESFVVGDPEENSEDDSSDDDKNEPATDPKVETPRVKYVKEKKYTMEDLNAHPDLYVKQGDNVYARAHSWNAPKPKKIQAFVEFKAIQFVKNNEPRVALVAISASDKAGRNMLDADYPELSSKELMFAYRPAKVPADIKAIFDAVKAGDTTHYITFEVEQNIANETTFMTDASVTALHNTTGWYAGGLFDPIAKKTFEHAAAKPVSATNNKLLDSANAIMASYLTGEGKYNDAQFDAAVKIAERLG